jgi:hypothetical protein
LGPLIALIAKATSGLCTATSVSGAPLTFRPGKVADPVQFASCAKSTINTTSRPGIWTLPLHLPASGSSARHRAAVAKQNQAGVESHLKYFHARSLDIKLTRHNLAELDGEFPAPDSGKPLPMI